MVDICMKHAVEMTREKIPGGHTLECPACQKDLKTVRDRFKRAAEQARRLDLVLVVYVAGYGLARIGDDSGRAVARFSTLAEVLAYLQGVEYGRSNLV